MGHKTPLLCPIPTAFTPCSQPDKSLTCPPDSAYFSLLSNPSRWQRSSAVEQGNHNPLVGGSNPSAATKFSNLSEAPGFVVDKPALKLCNAKVDSGDKSLFSVAMEKDELVARRLLEMLADRLKFERLDMIF